ncbi:hypothetical protein MMCCUG48898_0033 [Mycobacteroides abscessus subsp. massiliense CCUG 48898 = JCM 15300]|nr:hypothetical protein MMAS_01810 [Mycobacteroides abscessus subsp. massiliense CCUG 48898 = JCM 15300]EIV69096.1 hypothetical protein MMCCUG48898_0033 [Mycobacteroides abscessus subsp. massiliense CCUG 48898 = JCM 15300]BAP95019.1 hypothetical protein MMASJCM_0243 [Mycobacteroides abscessus subsp. massiliense CCUG 48898 = JCM 15300]
MAGRWNGPKSVLVVAGWLPDSLRWLSAVPQPLRSVHAATAAIQDFFIT